MDTDIEIRIGIRTAKDSLCARGCVSPMIVAIFEDGSREAAVTEFLSREDKYEKLTRAADLFSKHPKKVVGIVVIAEAWVRKIPVKDLHGTIVPPSQSSDRQEALMVSLYTQKESISAAVPFYRSGGGFLFDKDTRSESYGGEMEKIFGPVVGRPFNPQHN